MREIAFSAQDRGVFLYSFAIVMHLQTVSNEGRFCRFIASWLRCPSS